MADNGLVKRKIRLGNAEITLNVPQIKSSVPIYYEVVNFRGKGNRAVFAKSDFFNKVELYSKKNNYGIVFIEPEIEVKRSNKRKSYCEYGPIFVLAKFYLWQICH